MKGMAKREREREREREENETFDIYISEMVTECDELDAYFFPSVYCKGQSIP